MVIVWSAIQVLKTLDGKIAGILDGGICAVGIESTVIDMIKPTPVILRSGPVTAEMMRIALGVEVDCCY
jgi:L-threonylcarbamoyladenylate synthase